MDTRLALGLHRPGPKPGKGLVGLKADRMPHETARLEVLQGAGPVPGPLALDVEHLTVFIRSHTTGAADAAGNGDGLSIRSDLEGPAAKIGPVVVGIGESENHPDVSVGIRL